MKVVNNDQMREIDRKTIEGIGIPGIILMENAARQVCSRVEELGQSILSKITILCGPGNNGGDGFALCRQLLHKGYNCKCVYMGKEEQLKGDAKRNCKILNNIDSVIFIPSDLQKIIDESTLIVDCLFGTGLERPIEGFYKDCIISVNHSNAYVLSVDIASGVNGDTGQVMGVAIEADETVVLALPKVGNLLHPGAFNCGTNRLVDIDIPASIVEHCPSLYFTLGEHEAKALLPCRPSRSHKGTYGKVNLFMGSRHMPGASILAGKAAYKVGAGLVRMIVPKCIREIVHGSLVEAISVTYELPFLELPMDEILGGQVLGFGCGLGAMPYVATLLERFLEECKCPMVIDADGLNALAKNMDILKKKTCPVVLTPHMGEMCRLTGYTMEHIQKFPIESALQISKAYDVICVLKDARTVITSPMGDVYINTTGNHGLATAGSGDVLTGMICGFIAGGMEPYLASCLGVYYHGAAGDYLGTKQAKRSIVASDLLEALGGTLC